MTYEERATAHFKEGCNCTQSVLLAFSDDLDLPRETLLRLASSFGGGMGGLREVCGAVSGMLLVAGLYAGYSTPKDYAAKKAHYALVRELADAFRAEQGSIICRELLGAAEAASSIPQERTEAYYKKRPCAYLVGRAAAIVAKALKLEHS